MSAAAAGAPLLEVAEIEVAYGQARAVNGASVRVAPGAIKQRLPHLAFVADDG